MRRYLCTFTAFAALSIAVPAAAQTDRRFTAGASINEARTWSDESLLGRGLAIEGRVGVNLTAKTQIEFAINRIPYDRVFEFSQVETHGRSIFTALVLKHDFTRGRVRPFVLAGYGINSHRGHRITPDELGLRRFDSSSTDHGYLLGTGLVIARDRWEVGPEARIHMLAIEADSSVAMALMGGIRANVRF